MKGLLQRLSALDADAAAAVRVIAHYQALLHAGPVDPAVLTRATAGLLGCPAGMEPADGGRLRFGPDGRALPGAAGRASGQMELRPSGRVWLERAGGAGPLDALALEWMALAARVSGPSETLASPRAADPALVERVLSTRDDARERAHAMRRLGLRPDVPLRALALAAGPGDDPGVVAVTLLARCGLATPARVATVGALAAALLQPGASDHGGSPAPALRAALTGRGGEGAVRCGVGDAVPPESAAESWARATTALRFADAGGPDEQVVDHTTLGPLTLLAEVPWERLRAEPGVRALTALAERDGGRGALAALSAYCRTGSLRRAAASLHLHHSSVAGRLAAAEAALGWRLHQPDGLLRAQLALWAWRLHNRGPFAPG
ncbi:PucR C-terminal helix-turn-helix domain-containing protein [Streptomyces zhaozhouensis]|uniref:PucR C-terminal helix-turn-helix domain-containing protein n=1 Tax=Streptomyces zhaozhouensis TaxID=1300267 RepID=A0A286DUN5_9ACTN|nr:helix-turn-helix domain-containing protein [Streptomyces zhaozhouensis]SOD62377.1 PucR C-terminal helix-turn-helix domain-containing protein [Streptomyces zhaozhouensis]